VEGLQSVTFRRRARRWYIILLRETKNRLDKNRLDTVSPSTGQSVPFMGAPLVHEFVAHQVVTDFTRGFGGPSAATCDRTGRSAIIGDDVVQSNRLSEALTSRPRVSTSSRAPRRCRYPPIPCGAFAELSLVAPHDVAVLGFDGLGISDLVRDELIASRLQLGAADVVIAPHDQFGRTSSDPLLGSAVPLVEFSIDSAPFFDRHPVRLDDREDRVDRSLGRGGRQRVGNGAAAGQGERGGDRCAGQQLEKEVHENLLAEGSYSVGSAIMDGYPEFTLGVLKKLGWDRDLTPQEMAIIQKVNAANPDAVSWSTDLSGGIQRVAIEHGCAPGRGLYD
jgi:hypothetical protein